jgi:D-glycero-alpha-D-manno-heptose 1-phosphate guanylyltransferase
LKLAHMPTAIILAGGLGSRMRSIAGSVPKPMIEINGEPFLAYLLHYLGDQGINEIVLSVGYKSESITAYFGDQYGDIQIKYSFEDQPLGTGGAIRRALRIVKDKHAFIINGDTYFCINLAKLLDFHKSKYSCITIALKHMRNTKRYGKVAIDTDSKIIGIGEEVRGESSLINGGIYLISQEAFDDTNLPNRFSFEVEFLEKYHHQKTIYGLPFENYFIDIGVPLDYERAKTELKRFMR